MERLLVKPSSLCSVDSSEHICLFLLMVKTQYWNLKVASSVEYLLVNPSNLGSLDKLKMSYIVQIFLSHEPDIFFNPLNSPHYI